MLEFLNLREEAVAAGLSPLPATPLADHTTFRIGGTPEAFFEPRTPDGVQSVVQFCRDRGARLFLLGGGSNLLVQDGPLAGWAVLSVRGLTGCSTEDGRRVAVEGGFSFPRFVRQGVERGWSGVEALAGIPGTLAGALRMNAGGVHGSISQFVQSVTVLDREGHIRHLPAERVGFGYRMTNLAGCIVLGGTLQFEPGDPDALRRRFTEIVQRKLDTQPLQARSAGCIFKNPPGQSAGRLVDLAGFKGHRVGGALVSPKHANFVVNDGGATASDVLALVDEIRQGVEDRFGVRLDLEVDVWTDIRGAVA